MPWGGAVFRYSAAQHPPVWIWTAFPARASEFAHARRDFMIDLTVDHLDGLVARLRARHVPILKRETDQFGRYASILDPDGTKLELWEPARSRK